MYATWMSWCQVADDQRAPVVSVVIPLHNEEGNIVQLVAQVDAALGDVAELDFILVDDGSTDDTLSETRQLATTRSDVTALSLSRNFGHQAALAAGIDAAFGDAVVMMDGDGQHPASVLRQMFDAWNGGALVVVGKRRATEHLSWGKRATSKLYHRVLGSTSAHPPIPGASDFRLVDARVADALRQAQSRTMFYRGLLPWLGFDPAVIEYEEADRVHGTSSYSVGKMLRLSAAGIISYSRLPFLLVLSAVFATALLFLGYSAFVLYERFVSGDAAPGQASILLTIMITSLVQLIAISVAVIYAYRAYTEVSNRPLYVLREEIGSHRRREHRRDRP